ncbi:MAG: flagellar basal-body rod protein FlgG [Betaproteobacteria bacterium]|jgi:flagellar basal-body rod protein FlgG|nr:flagellar basal-body rod protein FlgG [Rhodocyclaceae bacterium]MCA3135281.1 flagellar basal-body rod protein FlgG [Rhodocyclaceae bacterium]MCA3141669.1 flagellar basal-body rod protein FlgG [Rhodocyclaceae bacterium]MCA3145313.1 flagellar basal-body rod protein FlgG [Rhodocyclaceae bacterium]MCE2896813.1 flagellar basal-body rod protein FlgG [Betaproteobacteria bacterium]
MIRSLWTAKSGLEAQQFNVDVISNNLANISTNGFKRQRPVFEDLLYQVLRQPGAQSSQLNQVPSGLQVGLGVRPVATARIFVQGNLQQTGNSLDVAINGQGFFQVLLPDGSTAYTRDGSFQLDNQGNVVTSSGYAIQPGITIPPNTTSITIGNDGTVTALVAGSSTPTQVGTIQLANFTNPAGLQSRGENLFLETASSGAPQVNQPLSNGLGSLNQSFVETSNVSATEELVNLITAQRAFEINSRSIQASDQMLQRLAQL